MLIQGTDGVDILEGTSGNDLILGLGSTDWLDGKNGNDTLDGGSGGDLLFGGFGDDSLLGGDGYDRLDGEFGDDTLVGGTGNDTFYDSYGSNVLEGGAGADTFKVYFGDYGDGSSVATGGTEQDFYELSLPAHYGVPVSESGPVSAAFDYAFVVTDFAAGTGGDLVDVDQVLVSSALLVLSGYGGSYGGGNPFDASLGYLRLVQSGEVALLQADLDGASQARFGWNTLLTLQGVNTAAMTAGNFVGFISPSGLAPGSSVLRSSGGVGDDVLWGWAGYDDIRGNKGADLLDGKGGDDTLDGGVGNDTLIGGFGNDSLIGGDGDDLISGIGFGDDTLLGGAGNDHFGSKRESTMLSDSFGQDVLDGGAGEDFFEVYFEGPAIGASTVTGGTERDTYRLDLPLQTFDYAFVVTDFAVGTAGDQMDVEPLLLNSGLVFNAYLGGNPFDATLGYLRLVQSSSDTLLQVDMDGASQSRFGWNSLLTLQGVDKNTLTADNFVGDIPPDGSDGAGRVVLGTVGDDTLVGGYFDDELRGDAGSDRLDGKGGDDTLDGGTGNDTLIGGFGNDSVIGGDGDDWFFSDNDLGDDTLIGGAGNDYFFDGNGVNVFEGGPGADFFWASNMSGWSTATGGTEQDTYQPYVPLLGDHQFVVTDFEAGAGGDLIDADLMLDFVGLNSYGGGNPFNVEIGVLRLVQAGSDTLLQVDADGPSQNGFAWSTVLILQGVNKTALTSDNFVGRLIVGTPENDTLVGGLGNDTIQGLAGDDVLDGSSGRDALEGGPGNDLYYVDNAADVVTEDAGAILTLGLLADGAPLQGLTDTIVAAIDYSLANIANVENLTLTSDVTASETGVLPRSGTGSELNNVLTGNALANTLDAAGGDDTLIGGGGNDSLDGGEGTDFAQFSGSIAQYRLLSYSDAIYVADMVALRDGIDRLVSIEGLRFVDASSVAPAAVQAFASLAYIASHADLINAFGTDAGAGIAHYVNWGSTEGRQITFDGLAYIASYNDLINAYGVNADGGAAHYIQWGRNEGRQTVFDGLAYIASYSDLINAFGANADAGAGHYIGYGRNEGRTTNFDGLAYIASYADLIDAFGANAHAGASHYISYGLNEGRTTSFDGLSYIASYADLINAFGANASAGAGHYIGYGRNEGRTTTFDGLEYIASYGDLIQAFGASASAGAGHYINYGLSEGRHADFDAVQYLANYADLQAAFGTDTHIATIHFIQYGYAEGRTDEQPG